MTGVNSREVPAVFCLPHDVEVDGTLYWADSAPSHMLQKLKNPSAAAELACRSIAVAKLVGRLC